MEDDLKVQITATQPAVYPAATKPAVHPAATQPAAPPRVTQPQHEKIHGWLFVALALLFFGNLYNLYTIVIHFIYIKYLTLPLFSISGYFVIVPYIFYMLYEFIKRKPDAIFLGKAMFFIIVFQNLVSSLLLDSDLSDTIFLFVNTIFQAIWLFYLLGSPQVARIYPKDERQAGALDYFIVGATFIIPFALLIVDLL
jgi:hypothetical protein